MCLEYQKSEQQTEQIEPFLAQLKLRQHSPGFVLRIQKANTLNWHHTAEDCHNTTVALHAWPILQQYPLQATNEVGNDVKDAAANPRLLKGV